VFGLLSSTPKVGEVTDESCKLEAMDQVLSNQIEELENKRKQIKKAQDSVNNKLKEALADTDSSDDTFGPARQTFSNCVDSFDQDEKKDEELASNCASSLWSVSVGHGGIRSTVDRDRSQICERNTEGSNSINFASGLSGHRGLNIAQSSSKNQAPRRHVMSMSHHAGVNSKATCW
jgi:uncharacterized protein YhaN